MTQHHVTSLELARKLKEAGYPQEGEFWWKHYEQSEVGELPILARDDEINDGFMEDYYAAPLCTELLEQLPEYIDLPDGSRKYPLIYKDHYGDERGQVYRAYLSDISNPNFLGEMRFENQSLPNALAEMWLWLKENSYL